MSIKLGLRIIFNPLIPVEHAAADAVPPVGWSRIFFVVVVVVQDAGDDSPRLPNGHRGVFNVHNLMRADRMPDLVSSEGRHTFVKQQTPCKTPISQLIVRSRIKL